MHVERRRANPSLAEHYVHLAAMVRLVIEEVRQQQCGGVDMEFPLAVDVP